MLLQKCKLNVKPDFGKAHLRRDSSWEYKCVRRRRRSSHLTHSASPLCIKHRSIKCRLWLIEADALCFIFED